MLRPRNPSIPLLSRVTVDGREGYVCGRTWPSTSHPEMYDVRVIDPVTGERETISNLIADRLKDVRDPDPEMLARVVSHA